MYLRGGMIWYVKERGCGMWDVGGGVLTPFPLASKFYFRGKNIYKIKNSAQKIWGPGRGVVYLQGK